MRRRRHRRGRLVLRFTYEDVTLHPDEVRDVPLAPVALAALLVEVGVAGWSAA